MFHAIFLKRKTEYVLGQKNQTHAYDSRSFGNSLRSVLLFLVTGGWRTIFPQPKAEVVLRANRTELKVNDTVTLTADINDEAVGGLGEPVHFVMLMDAPSYSLRPPRLINQAVGGYFNLYESQFLQLESIKREDNRITAVFRAMQIGRTRVRIGVNGEVCESLILDNNGQGHIEYGNENCSWNGSKNSTWNHISLTSQDLFMQVTDH